MSSHNCSVCGFYMNAAPWGEGNNSLTFEICPCCGVEFGNEDYTVESAKSYRAKWLAGGANWFMPKEKPADWDLNKQLKNIFKEFD